jgi:1-phosphatidylinositol-3-phosphate 5-kinase
MTKIARNASIAKVSSQLGAESTIVVYVVRRLDTTHTPDTNIFCIGQIFCSRCASNLIKGSRFGHDGTIRVCNLCFEKLTKVDDDDDDDRRSVVSSLTTFPSHQLGMDSLSLSLGHHPQSSFAPSQLVGRMDESLHLYSIAEAKRPKTGSDESGNASRPVTPSDILEGEKRHWQPFPDNPAPFRRGLSEEEKDAVEMSDSFINNDSVMSPGSKTPLNFSRGLPIVNTGGPISSIQFPVGSPDQGMDSPRPRSRTRSRFNSYGDFDVATPFIRSRVQSRVQGRLDGMFGEPGWRTRRESTA